MPFKTKSGSHYHETYGCHGATIACDTTGLEPCSDCCGAATSSGSGGSTGIGAGSGSGSGMAGGSQGEYEREDSSHSSSEAPSNPASPGMAGTQGESLDAYDSSMSMTHASELMSDGVSAMSDGTPAPNPRCGIVPEAFAGMTDSLGNFDIEPLECPDRIPATWGDSAPYPEPLPNWDAPMRVPGEYWFYEMESYSPDRILSMQVAGAISPAMDRWPGATSEMLRYGLYHGFMTAPASTAFHLNTPGGLACHSASVTDAAIRMMELPENEPIRRELGPDWKAITATVALWHDACKMDFYEPLDYPKSRPDGNVAFYGVTKSRQNDSRHGELSADIVRHFYGDALPEVAYEAISMHMGPWDHRRLTPKWVTDALDDDVQARRAQEEAERRAAQDEGIASGKISWQLKKKMTERRELAEAIRGKSEDDAMEMIAESGDPHAKRMRILRSRMRAIDGADEATASEYMQEMRQMLADCSAVAGMDDMSVIRSVLRDERGHADASVMSRRKKALRIKEENEAFAQEMERAWEEHPFIKLIHDADLASSKAGR